MQLDRTQPRVLRIIAENSGVNESCIELHHSLAADLGCDSLDCVELMMGLEEEFGVEIDDDDFAKCTTVQQVIDHVVNVCTKPLARCITHHYACECREQKIATQNKAALDAARLLDYAQSPDGLNEEEREECASVRDRLYAACEALYPAEDNLEQARRLIGASGIACCAEEAEHQTA